MRYALPLLALLSTTAPTWAMDIPNAEDREVIWTQIQTTYSGAFCPEYRTKIYQLSAYLKAHGFSTIKGLQERYPRYYKEMINELPSSEPKDRPRNCLDLWDKMGDFGIYPHILVRR